MAVAARLVDLLTLADCRRVMLESLTYANCQRHSQLVEGVQELGGRGSRRAAR